MATDLGAIPIQHRAREVLHTVIIPALNIIKYSGRAAHELVLGTGIQESGLIYRKQIRGPARGLFQMEPLTFDDLWRRFVLPNGKLLENMNRLLGGHLPIPKTLETNDRFAAAMCRVFYLRVAEPLPKAGDVENQARYWKQHYNTFLGKGKPEQYIQKWKRAVNDKTFTPLEEKHD